MSEIPIPAKHLAVLKQLHAALAHTDIVWAITGSTSFALQGMPVIPDDIDIQTDEAGAYAIEAVFSDDVLAAVCFSASEKIRSHFGRLNIDGLVVELMGAIQKRLPDVSWEEPVDVEHIRIDVTFNEITLPVLPLDYEYQAYMKLGRLERAQQIKAFLEQKGQ